MTKLYETTATAVGGREGKTTLSDSELTVNMVPAGSSKAGNNPEQLFAMGYAACFDSALNAVKRAEKAKFDENTQVTVSLNKQGDLDFYLAVNIHVAASNTDLSAAQIQEIVEKAHQVCPYSKATRGNIEVNLTSDLN